MSEHSAIISSGPPVADDCSGPAMIKIDGLTKRYESLRGASRDEDGRVDALINVSLRICFGEIYGLLGANGAGKTTLLRLLTTAIAPTAGTAEVGGWDIWKHPGEVRRQVGFVSQFTDLYPRLTPRETLHFFGALYDMEEKEIQSRTAELSEQLELASVLDRLNGTLSGGMRQRVSIARSLMHDPDVWILDEPTTGLDVPSAEAVLNLIATRSARSTVIFSTHHLWEAERLCHQIGVLSSGEFIFEGSMAQFRTSVGERTSEQAFLALLAAAPAGKHLK